MKQVILTLAFVFVAIGGSDAQPLQPNAVPAGQMLAGRFEQERHLAGMKAPLRSEGRFLIVPNNGLIWRSERPFSVATAITRGGLIQVVESSQTLRLPAQRIPFLRSFYDLLAGALTGDWSAIEQGFVMAREANGDSWRAVLTPASASMSDTTQIVRVDLTGRSFVDTVAIYRTNGDWERLTFLEQTISSTQLAPEDRRLIEAADE